ncbi:MAG: DNA adenine methylase [Gloeocapsa sp. UFS-A4-WI-NPMV-4B04]|jgi:DNA adenine methylase|nr:DNA adenine methylase [Gloeocapsa sp. UFS-A4-WI-NPMV-4B04]
MLIQNIQHSPRPFLKWAGGKSKLIKQYIPYFPKKFKTYYEPFLGGGAVFFHLQPKNAVITDINLELINVYRCVRDNLAELILLLEKHQYNHSKEYYYQIRSSKNINELERAARIIYLNKTCFNGLYRENSKGEFNVPMGRYKKPNICDLDTIRSASVALQSTVIEVRAFEDVLNYAKTSDDFIYFDPPYYPLSCTSNFTAYSSYSFNEYDQIRLKDTFVELAERGVKVMLSNSDCSFIRELYSKFKIYEITASRSINSNAKKRGMITEVLVTSY